MKKRNIIAIVLFVPVVIAWLGFLAMQYDIRSVKKQILYAIKEDSDNYDKITNEKVLGFLAESYDCAKDKPIKYHLDYFYGFHNFSSGVVMYKYTKICDDDTGDETGSAFVPVLATIKK